MTLLPKFLWRLTRLQWLDRHRARFRAPAPRPKPHLFCDVSVIIAHDAQTGIQRVVRAVWSELLKADHSRFELVPVFATARHGYRAAPLDFLDRPVDLEGGEVVGAAPGDHFLGLDLSAQFLPRYQDQLRVWRDAGAKIHVVVYDLLPLNRPEWFSAAAGKNFRRWFRTLIAHADQALCISRQVARDLREQLRLQDVRQPPPTIGYLGMGSDIAASRPSPGRCEDTGAIVAGMRFRPTILMVGTIEPRKGYDVAIAAFERLWEERGSEAPDLVIVGKPGWKTGDLQDRLREHPQHRRRLHWLRNVSDEDLCRLYAASRGVLMSSLGEGMGLPLLEAAQHGRPVLARDLTVFREAGVRNVIFFEDDQPGPLGEKILELARRGPTEGASSSLPLWRDSVAQLLLALGLHGPDETRHKRADSASLP